MFTSLAVFTSINDTFKKSSGSPTLYLKVWKVVRDEGAFLIQSATETSKTTNGKTWYWAPQDDLDEIIVGVCVFASSAAN